jgi:hypothetical protein
MRNTEALRCERGANCVSYPTLGEPSKLSRANPGPRCFACEEHRRDFQVEAFAAEGKALREAEDRLLWAEADVVEASEKST